MTFGSTIADLRKRVGLSQKDLAAKVTKDDGSPISPQYLNDIERDRRNPPSQYLLKQLARELHTSEDYLSFLAGQFPEDVRIGSHQPERVTAAMQAFRRALREG